jgi:hypothetical protein
MATLNNTKMKQDYECKFCGTKFHKEATLSVHMCVKKRRHQEIETAPSRLGFRTFQKFYQISIKSKHPKTVDDFINSQYYIDFVKFGNHLLTLKPINPEQFTESIIRNGVKLRDWTKDFVYDAYIVDLVKKEPADAGTERTINEIMEWSQKNKTTFNNFFVEVSANEAAYMIRTGKISPWVLYLCETGDVLTSKFNEDHTKIVDEIIDPGFWMKKFKKQSDDVEFIRNLLEAAGL